ncbi:MAG: DUF937 domain-containing protein [Chitinophagales bacterium]
MADLLRQLQSQFSAKTIDKIAGQIGGNQQQTSAAVSAALPMILQALSKNASNEAGAASLFNAIAKDHDGSALSNLSGLIGNFQNGPGAGILKHVLGPKQNTAETIVSQSSGLNSQATSQLLQILAPIVMGQLGKQKQKSGLDVGGLANLLMNNTVKQQKKAPQAASFLNQFLDQDGDGNIKDDLTNMGIKALSGYFRRK